MYEYCVKTTTISHGISHVWCVNLSYRACETLCEKDSIFHTLFHIVNRQSRVRAVMSRGSTGLVCQNTSCKAHKVCISLEPTGWDDVFCSYAHRLVHTRTHDRTRVHIKSIVGIEGHFRRAVLVLTGLKYLFSTSERKQEGLIITGGEGQWNC